jgi:hypothetical protein
MKEYSEGEVVATADGDEEEEYMETMMEILRKR